MVCNLSVFTELYFMSYIQIRQFCKTRFFSVIRAHALFTQAVHCRYLPSAVGIFLLKTIYCTVRSDGTSVPGTNFLAWQFFTIGFLKKLFEQNNLVGRCRGFSISFQFKQFFGLRGHNMEVSVLRGIDVGHILLAAIQEMGKYHAVNSLVADDHDIGGIAA